MSRLEELIQEHCPDGVEFKKLSEILSIRNGRDYRSFGEGNIPVYGSGGIMSYIDQYIYDQPSVLIPRKGSLEKLYYVETPFWTVDTIFYTEINTVLVVPKYVFYYLQMLHLEKLNKAGGVPSLTQAILNDVKVALPPLSVQNEIVRILDCFSELTARKKQYEYYRDLLLTFGDIDRTLLTERNGTERNGTERNGTERNGTERNGTERNEENCSSMDSLG